MTHCATGHCSFCTRQRRRIHARDWPTPYVPMGVFWDQKTLGSTQDIIGFWPEVGFGEGYKNSLDRRIYQEVI